jgi:hypothetical protein
LSVKECAQVFQQAAGRLGSRVGRTLGRFGAHSGNDFYTPTDDSPFAALDDDKPDFAVGTGISKFNAGAKGNASFVRMYVWDREAVREVVLACAHPLGGGIHAQRSVNGFVTAFKNADASCVVEANS